MAEGVRVYARGVLFLCFFINVFGGEIVKVADLYCRDPDDGSFHRVNTTWSSTTFCGNYTCHLKRKNHTEPEKKTTTSLNPIDLFEADLTTAGSEHKPSVAHGKRDYIDKQEKESDASKNLDLLLKSISDKEDRYLNEEEIKTITKMLHTIKKSDLETIVEIYTLAKDILKEIDKEEEMNNEIAEKIVENCKHDTRNKLNMPGLPRTKDGLLYEPSDEMIPMKNEASRHGAIVSSLKPKEHIQQEAPMIPLSEKVPYYYPMSGFQRSHSYIHHHNRPQKATSPRVHPPLKKKMNSSNDFIPSAVPNPFYEHYAQAQRQMVPVSLLPYPYPPVNQQHAYTHFNPYNLYNPQMYSNLPANSMAQTVEIPKNLLSLIIGNIAMKNDDAESSAETKPIQKINPAKEKLLSVVKQKAETATLPKWQTKELSNEILNEIKANVLNQRKLGLLPMKKMGRLEKVGKAIKIDDLGRKKRSILEKEEPKVYLDNEYELYLEKITNPTLRKRTENSTSDIENKNKTYSDVRILQTSYPVMSSNQVQSVMTPTVSSLETDFQKSVPQLQRSSKFYLEKTEQKENTPMKALVPEARTTNAFKNDGDNSFFKNLMPSIKRLNLSTTTLHTKTACQLCNRSQSYIEAVTDQRNPLIRAQRDHFLKIDSDHLFFMSLMPSVKKLTENQKLSFRINMYEWLLNAVRQNVCPSLYEPGYFQVGDKSKAFPACCPRKLDKALLEPEPETTTESEADPFAGKSFIYRK